MTNVWSLFRSLSNRPDVPLWELKTFTSPYWLRFQTSQFCNRFQVESPQCISLPFKTKEGNIWKTASSFRIFSNAPAVFKPQSMKRHVEQGCLCIVSGWLYYSSPTTWNNTYNTSGSSSVDNWRTDCLSKQKNVNSIQLVWTSSLSSYRWRTCWDSCRSRLPNCNKTDNETTESASGSNFNQK